MATTSRKAAAKRRKPFPYEFAGTPDPADAKARAAREARTAKITAKVKARWALDAPHKDPATSDRSYSPAELEFLKAVDAYKTRYQKTFLRATDYFYVLTVQLGYVPRAVIG